MTVLTSAYQQVMAELSCNLRSLLQVDFSAVQMHGEGRY